MNGKVETYSRVRNEDIELIRTVSLFAKMNNEAVRDSLLEAYEHNDSDIQTKLAYAFYNLTANTSNDVLESKMKVEAALVALEEILEEQPDHWLAGLYRIRILLMLPSHYRDLTAILQELEDMIETQRNGVYEPYFIAPYLLVAEVYLSQGDLESARAAVEQAKQLEPKALTGLASLIGPLFGSLREKFEALRDSEASSRVRQLQESFVKAS
ncbi:hypothetical protein [Gorillibacterium sp. sgz500922]|uniref:hypothetical protein n=1 Tax=Gorillibacterium sp. sgz500922 TaxID=3446694 RepID=UPI003F672B7A